MNEGQKGERGGVRWEGRVQEPKVLTFTNTRNKRLYVDLELAIRVQCANNGDGLQAGEV